MASSIKPGQTFARYVIEASIGQGGMGEVYRAHDETLRRKVALKVIHPDLAVPDAAARLVREARAAAALTHPNTVAIHDLGEIDGTVFLVMELVSGSPLRAYVGDSSIPVTRKLRWLADIARGLAAAHRAGLIHRDVKPSNVMITDDDRVKVLDFGLAKPLEAASFRTDAGMVVGTPGYMAPELFTGAPADSRTDQYAFGVTAYELLSGVHPGNPMGPVPPALDARVANVGASTARIIARTLSRSPEDRFASLTAVAEALEQELTTTRAVAATSAPATRREGALALAKTELQEPTSSRPTRVIVVALAALLVGAGGFLAFQFANNAYPFDQPPAPDASLGPALVDAAALETDAAPEASTTPDAALDAATIAIAEDAEAGVEEAGSVYVPFEEFPDPWKKDAAR